MAKPPVRTWTGPSGLWNDPAMWNPAGPSLANEDVKMGGAGETMTIPAGCDAVGGRVYVASLPASTLHIAQGGSFAIAGADGYIKIGFKQKTGVCIVEGDLLLTDGSHIIVADGSAEYDSTCYGELHMKSGRATCNELFVGARKSTGKMFQTGGSVTAKGVLVGDEVASKGTYRLTGGTLSCSSLAIFNGPLSLASAATVTVTGSFTCHPGGMLALEMPTAQDQPGIRDIAGNATLAQGSILQLELGFDPKAGAEYTILSVTAGHRITGNFTQVPAGWSTHLVDDDTKLVLKYGK